MRIIENLPQDRIISEVYAWVIVDPDTHLEGIAGISIEGRQMQAVTSSRAIAMQMRDMMVDAIRATGKQAKLVRFVKQETIEGGLQ